MARKKILDRIILKLFRNYFLSSENVEAIMPYINLAAINQLDIREFGVDGDTPFVRLGDGTIFFGFPPNQYERKLFELNHKKISNVNLESFAVALDIAQRYCFENAYFYHLPRSFYLKPGSVHIDIGAFIGFGALKCAKTVGQNGKVICVEIEKQNFNLLQRNVEENNLSNVEYINKAISENEGSIEYFSGDKQNNSIIEDDEFQHARNSGNNLIKSTTIDNIIEDYGLSLTDDHFFVSIEINGAEPNALKGAGKFLSNANDFAMRIAAPYSREEESNSDLILAVLKEYKEIQTYYLPTWITVWKNSANKL